MKYFLTRQYVYYEDLVKRNPDDWEITQKPAPYYFWDVQSWSWQWAPEQYKMGKKVEMVDKFNMAQYYGYTCPSIGLKVNSSRFDLDNVSRIIKYMESSGAPSILFRIYDNSFVTLTLAQMKSMELDLIEYGLFLYQKKWNKEAEIDAASTYEEIQAISWD